MTDSSQKHPCLFTIGHSDHEMPSFLALLWRHGVDAIADVRSQPYSRFHGQFNRDILSTVLKRAGIDYVFLGRELGARRAEQESYDGDQARYDLIARLPAFRAGLERIRCGLNTHRVALLCAEKDPITCHRMVLIGRQFRSDSVDIRHILEDGSIESMDLAEARLLDAVRLPAEHLFHTRAELVEMAYDLQARRIAYTESQNADMTSGVRT